MYRRPPVGQFVEDEDLAARANGLVDFITEQTHYFVLIGRRAVTKSVCYFKITQWSGIIFSRSPEILLQRQIAVREKQQCAGTRIADVVAAPVVVGVAM
jgi:hypothetical protein